MNDIMEQLTEDGSYTLYSSRFREHYHSIHGAVSESLHIFIQAGLEHWTELAAARRNPFVCHPEDKTPADRCRILEVGFGTGLNAWLTAKALEKSGQHGRYESFERYPVALSDFHAWPVDPLFTALHKAAWNQPVSVNDRMMLFKRQEDFTVASLDSGFDLVYYDAFSPDTQPEMWQPDLFRKVFEAMAPQGILTTYCAKGAVRRILLHCGFIVERLPGPAGKREILRATKP